MLAAYYYNLDLLPSSTEKHDAAAPDGRQVQITATQGLRSVAMRSEPEHLLVLWLDDNAGNVYEIYNGPGSLAWDVCGKLTSNGTKSITVSKLKKIAAEIPLDQRLEPVIPIDML